MEKILTKDAIVILGVNPVALSTANYLSRENYYNIILVNSHFPKVNSQLYHDVLSLVSLIQGDVLGVKGNLLQVKYMDEASIDIEAAAIIITDTKYLDLFLDKYIYREFELNHRYQVDRLYRSLFLSPTIFITGLSEKIQVKIGALIGRQVNLMLMGEVSEAEIPIICRDNVLEYIPHKGPVNGVIPLIYKSDKKLSYLIINGVRYVLRNGNEGILTLDMKKLLEKDRDSIVIEVVYESYFQSEK